MICGVRIVDPYDVDGVDRKAQLHTHTTNSDGELTPSEVAALYRGDGYAFLVFTDHNRVTPSSGLSDETFVVISGEENTIPRYVRPLGPHLGRLFVNDSVRDPNQQAVLDATVRAGGVSSLNHPSWNGNLWSAQWTRRAMRRLRGYHLVEVWNPHSRSATDTARWAAAVAHHGPRARIAPVAADDFHRPSHFNRAWTVARTAAVTGEALRAALITGAVYATTGPAVRFRVRDGEVTVESDAARVRFLNARGEVRQAVSRSHATYEPVREDRLVRVECFGSGAGQAWSNAFWIEG